MSLGFESVSNFNCLPGDMVGMPEASVSCLHSAFQINGIFFLGEFITAMY
jgi:hypothetical protein